jgi:6-phosphogluconolactonase
MTGKTLEIFTDKAKLISGIAGHFTLTVEDLLREKYLVHVVLTGGTVGIALLRDIDPENQLDWSRVHLWWGDERFVATGHADRNEGQATEALIHRLPIPARNVHRMPATGSFSLEEAARAYQAELAAFTTDLNPIGAPSFDITFLGVGPDAHIASLFPGLDGVTVTDQPVIAVHNSPKPPAERVSLTLPVLNASQRVWIVAAGADKAEAVKAAVGPADASAAPVSAVHGQLETVLWLDADAAALISA